MDQRNSADPCDVLGKHCVFKATGMINYDEGLNRLFTRADQHRQSGEIIGASDCTT